MTKIVQQDWTTGRSSELADRKLMNTPATEIAGGGEHAEHANHNITPVMPLKPKIDYSALDRLIAIVQPLNLPAPVMISPPSKKLSAWAGGSPVDWTARSETQNRPLRVNLVLDAATGEIKSTKKFADKPLLDRIIGYGIAIHEGQLFGWFNQALGVFTALGLLLMVVSSVVLWWRRRSPGTLGAPNPDQAAPRFAYGLIGIIVMLGILLPFLGITMILVLLMERWVLRHIPSTRKLSSLHKLKQEQLIGLLFVTALHGVGLYGLLRYEFIPIRDEAVVLMANFINPPVPEPEQPKPPEPDLPKPRPVEPPKPKQLVAQTPVVLPDEPVVPVPPPEPVVEPIPLDPQPIESPKPQQLVAQAPVVLPAPPEVIALSSELSVICLERAAPYYPTLSKRMDEQGRVVLRVRLGEDGKVTNAIIQTSSGFARLDNAALEAVRTWRCNPPVRNGVVMSASALQPFNFSLSQ